MSTVTRKIRTIRVAAVQAHTILGQTQANVERFTPLVEQAARQGAPDGQMAGYFLFEAICHVDALRGRRANHLSAERQRKAHLAAANGQAQLG